MLFTPGCTVKQAWTVVRLKHTCPACHLIPTGRRNRGDEAFGETAKRRCSGGFSGTTRVYTVVFVCDEVTPEERT